MFGGYSKGGIAEAEDIVKAKTADINVNLGKHYESFKINEVYYIEVDRGTNYFMHLTSNTGDKISVAIYVPLPHMGVGLSVLDAHQGHQAPHHHDH